MGKMRLITTSVIVTFLMCAAAVSAGAAELVLTPEDMADCNFVMAEAEAVVPYSSAITVHWEVPENTTCSSIIFHKYAGDIVIVDVTLTGATNYCYVGVIGPTRDFNCIATKTKCSQSFTVAISGYSCFAVYNPTSSTVKVDGTYEK